MKLEANKRLLARRPGPAKHKVTLEVSSDDTESFLTLMNMLGVIQWNGMVGHSATVGGSFDGDGAGLVRIEGLPDADYSAIGEACASHDDGIMAKIGAHSAKCVKRAKDGIIETIVWQNPTGQAAL